MLDRVVKELDESCTLHEKFVLLRKLEDQFVGTPEPSFLNVHIPVAVDLVANDWSLLRAFPVYSNPEAWTYLLQWLKEGRRTKRQVQAVLRLLDVYLDIDSIAAEKQVEFLERLADEKLLSQAFRRMGMLLKIELSTYQLRTLLKLAVRLAKASPELASSKIELVLDKAEEDPSVRDLAIRFVLLSGETPLALEKTKKWYRESSASSSMHRIRAMTLMISGDYSRAIKEFFSSPVALNSLDQDAIKFALTFPGVLQSVTDVLCSEGEGIKYEKLILVTAEIAGSVGNPECLDRLITLLGPTVPPQLSIYRIRLALLNGDDEVALTQLRELIKKGLQNRTVFLSLLNVLKENRHGSGMIELLDSESANYLEEFQEKLWYSRAYLFQKEYDKARQHLMELASRQDDKSNKTALIDPLLQVGELDSAEELFVGNRDTDPVILTKWVAKLLAYDYVDPAAKIVVSSFRNTNLRSKLDLVVRALVSSCETSSQRAELWTRVVSSDGFNLLSIKQQVNLARALGQFRWIKGSFSTTQLENSVSPEFAAEVVQTSGFQSVYRDADSFDNIVKDLQPARITVFSDGPLPEHLILSQVPAHSDVRLVTTLPTDKMMAFARELENAGVSSVTCVSAYDVFVEASSDAEIELIDHARDLSADLLEAFTSRFLVENIPADILRLSIDELKLALSDMLVTRYRLLYSFLREVRSSRDSRIYIVMGQGSIMPTLRSHLRSEGGSMQIFDASHENRFGKNKLTVSDGPVGDIKPEFVREIHNENTTHFSATLSVLKSGKSSAVIGCYAQIPNYQLSARNLASSFLENRRVCILGVSAEQAKSDAFEELLSQLEDDLGCLRFSVIDRVTKPTADTIDPMYSEVKHEISKWVRCQLEIENRELFGVRISELIMDSVVRYFQSSLWKILGFVEAMRQTLSETLPAYVCVLPGRLVEMRLLVRVARSLRVPSFDIQSLMVSNAPRYLRPIADVSFVIDHLQKDLYVNEFGLCNESIHLSGYPGQAPMVSDPVGVDDRRELLPELWQRSKYLVTYAAQPGSLDSGLYLARALVNAVLKDSDLSLLIKLHPRERGDLVERYLAMVGSVDGSAGRVAVSRDKPLGDCMAVSDLVVTKFSNAGLEAAIMGLPVISINLLGESFTFDLSGIGLARLVETEEELATALVEMTKTDEVRKQWLERQEDYFMKNPQFRSGAGSVRIRDTIERILDGKGRIA